MPHPPSSELVRVATERIAASGSGSPRLDAELLLGQALGDGPDRHPRLPGRPRRRRTRAQAFEAAVARRERGEPVAYIRGFREFHGLAFATDSRALIPRPETELLVDAALAEVAARLAATPRPPGRRRSGSSTSGRGPGRSRSRCSRPCAGGRWTTQVLVIAVDVSADALQLARENAVGPRRRRPDGVRRRGPPAVPRRAAVRRGVREPPVRPDRRARRASRPSSRSSRRSALDGGPDGLDVVRRLLDALPAVARAGRRRVPRDRRGPGRRDRAGGRGRGSRTARCTRDARPRRAARASRGSSLRPREPARPARTRGRTAAPATGPRRPSRSGSSPSTSTGPSIGHDFRISDRTVAAIREAVARGVQVSIATGRMPTSAARVREPPGADRPDHRPPGRGRPRDAVGAEPPSTPPTRRSARRSGGSSATRRWPPRSAARRSPGAWSAASTRTSTTWSGSSSGAATPRFEDYSGYLGPEADIVGDLAASVRKPVSKVIAVGDPPRPMELIEEARRTFAGRAGATRLAPPVPRVRRAGRVEGPGGRLARAPGRASRWAR